MRMYDKRTASHRLEGPMGRMDAKTVRLPTELWKRIEAAADEAERTPSDFLRRHLDRTIERTRPKHSRQTMRTDA